MKFTFNIVNKKKQKDHEQQHTDSHHRDMEAIAEVKKNEKACQSHACVMCMSKQWVETEEKTRKKTGKATCNDEDAEFDSWYDINVSHKK